MGGPARTRREQLQALLAEGDARLERAAARSRTVGVIVGVLRRERPVGVGILAAALAFRLFALVIPFAYVLVAGLGLTAGRAEQAPAPGHDDGLGALVVDSMAAATRTSQRSQWLALLLGGVTTLLAAAAVVEVLRWVHRLAWRVGPGAHQSRWLAPALVAGMAVVMASSGVAERARAAAGGLAPEVGAIVAGAAVQFVLLAVLWLALTWALPRPAVPWTALLPGSLLFAAGFQGYAVAVRLVFVPRAARASAVYGSLGVALVVLVSLFLFARLAVGAAELTRCCGSADRAASPPRTPSAPHLWRAPNSPSSGDVASPGRVGWSAGWEQRASGREGAKT